MNFNKLKVVNDTNVKWISQHWDSNNYKENIPHFAFLSIPFDYAVSHRPGTRFGPENILNILNSYSLYCSDKRVSLENSFFHNLNCVDIEHSLEKTYKNIEETVKRIPKDYIPIFLGGDHSISDPILRGMKKRIINKEIGLIIFDNHFDFRTPIAGKEHSGHWLKTIEDIIDYNNVAIVGIGAPIYSEKYLEEMEEKGILIKTVYDVRKNGREKITNEVLEHVLKKSNSVYFSVDIDSIDQAFAPGTSVPNPNGLFPFEVIDSIYEICNIADIVGIDITEVSPVLDNQQNFTSHVAANIIINFMAGIINNKNQK